MALEKEIQDVSRLGINPIKDTESLKKTELVLDHLLA
jgi:hypothetical protein